NRSGAVTKRISTSPTKAPVVRTCVSRSEETPEARITFETTPLTAQSVAALAAIAAPTRGRRRSAGATGKGASLTAGQSTRAWRAAYRLRFGPTLART